MNKCITKSKLLYDHLTPLLATVQYCQIVIVSPSHILMFVDFHLVPSELDKRLSAFLLRFVIIYVYNIICIFSPSLK